MKLLSTLSLPNPKMVLHHLASSTAMLGICWQQKVRALNYIQAGAAASALPMSASMQARTENLLTLNECVDVALWKSVPSGTVVSP
jgi:hypothetical protein